MRSLPFPGDQIIVQLFYRNHISFRTSCASPRRAYSFAQCVSYFSCLLRGAENVRPPFYNAAWMAGSMNFHICLGRTTQNTVCDPLTRYRLCCNSDSDAESSGSLRLCFVTTHNKSFNGFERRSAATGLRKRSSCVPVLISVRRYANCARWKKFYKNVALSA
jgi:hypothetical protein